MTNAIPAMTDPMGQYWDQPKDIRQAEMDETHVILTPEQIKGLCNYDRSLPSGTYSGKCWLRTNEQEEGPPLTWLVWYGEIDGDDILIHRREVLVLH